MGGPASNGERHDHSCAGRHEHARPAAYHPVLDTGLRGRAGIFELVPFDDSIRDAIMAQKSADRLAQIARRDGMRSLREDGWAKVAGGMTVPEEVVRVTGREGR